MSDETGDRLLLPREAAVLLRITSQTLARWARDGKPVGAVRLPSGTHRYREADIRKLMEGAR